MVKTGYSLELQGLRGVCIMLVVLLHYVIPYGGDLVGRWWPIDAFFRVSNAGWIGVDVFFALSGFVVTLALLKSQEGGYLGFMWRRATRLLPAYFAVLAVAGIISVFVPTVFGIRDGFLEAQPWAWALLANVASSIDGSALDGGGITLVHLWSLCVEFQFYALWPLVIWGLDGRARLVTVATVAVIALLARGYATSEGVYYNAVYSLTFFRMDGFAFGALAALMVQVGKVTRFNFAAALLLLVPTLVYLLSSTSWHKADPIVQVLCYTTLAAGSACLISALYTGAAPTIVIRAFSSRILTWTGDRSYSLYIWHLPFQPLVNQQLALVLPKMHPVGAVVISMAANATITLACSEISYRFLETVGHRRRPKD